MTATLTYTIPGETSALIRLFWPGRRHRLLSSKLGQPSSKLGQLLSKLDRLSNKLGQLSHNLVHLQSACPVEGMSTILPEMMGRLMSMTLEETGDLTTHF